MAENTPATTIPPTWNDYQKDSDNLEKKLLPQLKKIMGKGYTPGTTEHAEMENVLRECDDKRRALCKQYGIPYPPSEPRNTADLPIAEPDTPEKLKRQIESDRGQIALLKGMPAAIRDIVEQIRQRMTDLELPNVPKPTNDPLEDFRVIRQYFNDDNAKPATPADAAKPNAPSWSAPMQKKVIAAKLGIPSRVLTEAVKAGRYTLDPLTRKNYRIDLGPLSPELRANFATS
jgi:hypothetical protein